MADIESGAYRQAIEAAAATLAAAADRQPEAPVPPCPDWRIVDLVGHVGALHGWVTALLTAPSPESAARPEPPPGGAGAVLTWARAQTETMLTAMQEGDPEKPCWTFFGPGEPRFWMRRMAHETGVHAWDAAQAVGESFPLDPELSADGLDEYLGLFLPRRLARTPGSWAGETVHFHRTDGEGEWLLRLGPNGAVESTRAHGKGDLALRGPAADLYLFSLNRGGGHELEHFGDESLLARWRDELRF